MAGRLACTAILDPCCCGSSTGAAHLAASLSTNLGCHIEIMNHGKHSATTKTRYAALNRIVARLNGRAAVLEAVTADTEGLVGLSLHLPLLPPVRLKLH